MATSRVFVSHSHHDNDYCREFVRALREQGHQVWYDEHNLGWGALRATIEKEMPQCQHFIAIFSPDAVASDWVNAEIDAALDLLKEGVLETITFVVARECVVPLLLRRWKRIEGRNSASIPAQEAAGRAAAILASAGNSATPPVMATPTAAPPILPPDRFPPRLAQLGFVAENRNGVACIIPPICQVPAGEFLMGSDKRRDSQARNNEQPQHRVNLAAYAIARFPVTVAEYACFVEGANHRQPQQWANQLQKLDHPVVYVSWVDAVAYAAWLAKLTQQPWRLPTEAEWEKAARWDTRAGVARLYPWGDTFDASRANTSEGGKGGTTAVGAYPKGASPYGAEEMAGNVWEWTHSLYKPYPYTASDGREVGNSTGNRTRRGGSWSYNAINARAAFRINGWPVNLDNYIGVRLALAAGSA